MFSDHGKCCISRLLPVMHVYFELSLISHGIRQKFGALCLPFLPSAKGNSEMKPISIHPCVTQDKNKWIHNGTWQRLYPYIAINYATLSTSRQLGVNMKQEMVSATALVLSSYGLMDGSTSWKYKTYRASTSSKYKQQIHHDSDCIPTNLSKRNSWNRCSSQIC